MITIIVLEILYFAHYLLSEMVVDDEESKNLRFFAWFVAALTELFLFPTAVFLCER